MKVTKFPSTIVNYRWLPTAVNYSSLCCT